MECSTIQLQVQAKKLTRHPLAAASVSWYRKPGKHHVLLFGRSCDPCTLLWMSQQTLKLFAMYLPVLPAGAPDVILHFYWKHGHKRIPKVLKRLQHTAKSGS